MMSRDKAQQMHIAMRNSKKQQQIKQNRQQIITNLLVKTPFSEQNLINEQDYQIFIQRLKQYVSYARHLKQSSQMSSPLINKIIDLFQRHSDNFYQKIQLAKIINKICLIPDYKFIITLWDRAGSNTILFLSNQIIAKKFVIILGNGILSLFYAPSNLNQYLKQIFKHDLKKQSIIRNNLLWLLTVIIAYCPRDVPFQYQNIENINQLLKSVKVRDAEKKLLIMKHLYQRYEYLDIQSLNQFSGALVKSQTRDFRVFLNIFKLFLRIILTDDSLMQEHSNLHLIIRYFFSIIDQEEEFNHQYQQALEQVTICCCCLSQYYSKIWSQQFCIILSKAIDKIPEKLIQVKQRLIEIVERNTKIDSLNYSSDNLADQVLDESENE